MDNREAHEILSNMVDKNRTKEENEALWKGAHMLYNTASREYVTDKEAEEARELIEAGIEGLAEEKRCVMWKADLFDAIFFLKEMLSLINLGEPFRAVVEYHPERKKSVFRYFTERHDEK